MGIRVFQAQNFPDAPNQPEFPCAVLEPGQIYTHRILYEFGLSIEKEVKIV